jgi:hypothetical protein
MEQLRVSILILGALLSVAGLLLLGFGRPHGRLARRITCTGAPFMPVTTYTALLGTYAPSRGGFLSPLTLGLIMLSPWLLLWLVACFLAWAAGKTPRS